MQGVYSATTNLVPKVSSRGRKRDDPRNEVVLQHDARLVFKLVFLSLQKVSIKCQVYAKGYSL